MLMRFGRWSELGTNDIPLFLWRACIMYSIIVSVKIRVENGIAKCR